MAVGDFHGKFPKNLKKKAQEADLILCTGDLGGSDKLLKVIFKYFAQKWWKKIGMKKAKEYILEDYNSGKKILKELSSLNKPVYILPGNWDFISKDELDRTAGLNFIMYPKLIQKESSLHYWKRGIKKIGKLKILSFGGKVTAGEYINKNGFYKDRPKKLKKYIRENKKQVKQIMKYGSYVDILFAHYPPYRFFDIVKFKGKNPMNGKHVGFKGYTQFIKKYSPNLFICGHMHEYQGKKKFGKTTIIATGAAKYGKAVMINYNILNKKFKIDFIK